MKKITDKKTRTHFGVATQCIGHSNGKTHPGHGNGHIIYYIILHYNVI